MAAVLRGPEVAARMTRDSLTRVLAGLISDRIIYFPIRHHSPACARHLESLIRDRKPRAILIEGPAAFGSLIPLILHPGTRPPFAIYTSFVQEDPGEPGEKANRGRAASFGPPRHAAYYPFCAYSPEWVALRAGSELGASLRFIDLDYPDQIQAQRVVVGEGQAPRIGSLLTERHLKRSAYLQDLARVTGCRDHNDLWDHLFETRLPPASGAARSDSENFLRDVAAWCYFARADATEAEFNSDGTIVRERAMASAIREELALGDGLVVVITGGFHTVALPALVAMNEPGNPPQVARTKTMASICLIRYGFEQLDALNGYAAGMPSPSYYNRLWYAEPGGIHATDRYADTAASFLVELGRLTRETKLGPALSPADEIAALEHARHLALLRGRPGPLREDLLDGIRSCFVKGGMDAEGTVILGLAHRALTGTSIGDVPVEAGMPPLVEDFRRVAQALRLGVGDSVRRQSSLDLYRKVSHRRSSRFFHSLRFLEVPFGVLESGPDFASGTGLERLCERWSYQWTPQTEGRLVEASLYGATVEEATANRLLMAIGQLEATGRGRSAKDGVDMLVSACRMGVHRHAGRLLALISGQAEGDPALASLAQALGQLILLWESREPLEAYRLGELPGLIQVLYRRACYLLHALPETSADAARETLEALVVLRDLLRSEASGGAPCDPHLFYRPLLQALEQPHSAPLLAGGLAGLLYGDGRLLEKDLLKLLAGNLNAALMEAERKIAFLVGLLRTCRELAWRQPALVSAVDELLASWSEEEFVRHLPHLRVAFAELAPSETDRVAAIVAGLRGGKPVGVPRHYNLSETEILLAARINALVGSSLKEDGLGAWSGDEDSGVNPAGRRP